MNEYQVNLYYIESSYDEAFVGQYSFDRAEEIALKGEDTGTPAYLWDTARASGDPSMDYPDTSREPEEPGDGVVWIGNYALVPLRD